MDVFSFLHKLGPVSWECFSKCVLQRGWRCNNSTAEQQTSNVYVRDKQGLSHCFRRREKSPGKLDNPASASLLPSECYFSFLK